MTSPPPAVPVTQRESRTVHEAEMRDPHNTTAGAPMRDLAVADSADDETAAVAHVSCPCGEWTTPAPTAVAAKDAEIERLNRNFWVVVEQRDEARAALATARVENETQRKHIDRQAYSMGVLEGRLADARADALAPILALCDEAEDVDFRPMRGWLATFRIRAAATEAPGDAT